MACDRLGSPGLGFGGLGEFLAPCIGGGAGLMVSFRPVQFRSRARGRVWRARVLSQIN